MPTTLSRALLSVLAATLLASSSHAAPPSTQEVWRHHIQAWEARDLAAITADYTDGSVLILNNQTFRGKAAITSVFRQLFQLFDQGQNVVDTPTVDGRTVYITWHFTPKGEGTFFGSDSFVVEKGKIQIQTIASELYLGHPIQP
ncbi:nuclear transport factor 2 family protein [Archangium primigenium]|uniref:nuclear transport factor 2 family protein n=1 Tax=[Archangium] primigenium TaxID=2792470 RepID=UPI00195A4CD0|nr:nuclear transport factor 2 family protein [Archangium primigenium]MBM7116841.1 nuclear transport factor 2 family protein [Archangium primigenium]